MVFGLVRGACTMDDLEDRLQEIKDRRRVHRNTLRKLEPQKSRLGVNIDIQLENFLIQQKEADSML